MASGINLKKKKFLPILLAIAVAVTYCIPTWVFAEETNNKAEEDKWIESFATEIADSGNSGYLCYDKDGNLAKDGNEVVKVKKTISQKDNKKNEFDVNLEIQTKKEVQVEPDKDAAVILILDKSSYMQGGKMQSAKEAADHFVDEFAKNSGNGKRLFALVEMGKDADTLKYGNKYYLNVGGNNKQNKNKGAVKIAISKIDTSKEKGTNFESTLYLTRNLMKKISDENPNVKSKTVIFMTNGVPNLAKDRLNKINPPKVDYGLLDKIETSGKSDGWTAYWDLDEIGPCIDEIHGMGAKVYGMIYAYQNGAGDIGQSDKGFYVGDTNKHKKTWYKLANWLKSKKADNNHTYYSSYHNRYYNLYVGMDEIYSAQAGTEALKAEFKKINEQITNNMAASANKFTDYVVDPVEVIKGSLSTENGQMEQKGITIEWNLDKGKENGDWTTYKAFYKVRLRADKETFVENEEYGIEGSDSQSSGPVNKPVLTYTYNENGNASDTKSAYARTDARIKGEIPEVECEAQYFMLDKETFKYPKTPTHLESLGKHKLYTKLSAPDGYKNKYEDKYYYLSEADTIATVQKVGRETNVLKFCYQPTDVTLTVKDIYTTDILDDQGKFVKTETKEVERTLPEQGQGLWYAGDIKTVHAVKEFNNLTYTVDKEFQKLQLQRFSYENKITFNYKGTCDPRAKVDVKIWVVYKNGKWSEKPADDGHFKEEFTTSTKSEHPQYKATVPTPSKFVQKIKEVKDGYEFESATGVEATFDKDSKALTIERVSENGHDIVVTLVKHAPAKNKASIKVTHEYDLREAKIENGEFKLQKVDLNPVIEEIKDGWYEGEIYTPVSKNSYEGQNVNFNLVGGTDALKPVTLGKNGNNIKLQYQYTKGLDELQKATVTVNHIYKTKGTKLNDDGDKEDYEFEDSRVTKNINQVVLSDGKRPFYEGESFTPAALINTTTTKSYTLEGSLADKTITLKAGNDNVIDLVYYHNDGDTRDDAQISVKQVYELRGKAYNQDGKLETNALLEQKENTVEVKDRKAGDKFDPKTVAKIEGYDEYELQNKDSIKEIKLKKGANDTVELHYVKKVDKEKLVEAALKVTYKYITRMMRIVENSAEWVKDNSVEPKEVKTFKGKDADGKDVNENTQLYKNQKVTIESGLDKDGKYDGKAYMADSQNPAFEFTLGEVDNTKEYTYYHNDLTKELPKKAVKVNYEYTKVGKDKFGKETKEIEPKNETLTDYVGKYIDFTPNTNGGNLTEFTASAGAKYSSETEGTYRVYVGGTNVDKPVDTELTFKYMIQGTDYSIENEATVTVNTYTRTVDYNEDVNTKGYDLKNPIVELSATKTVDSYGGLTYTEEADSGLEKLGYKFDKAEPNADADKKVTITLQKGNQNMINLYYTKKIDTRVDTELVVTKRFYKHDTSGSIGDKDAAVGGTLEKEKKITLAGKNDGIYVGNTYTAEKTENYDGKNYNLKLGQGDIATITLVADKNELVVNYVREYDAQNDISFTVEHVYKIDGNIDNTVGKTVVAKYGESTYGTWDNDAEMFTAKPLFVENYREVTSAAADYTNIPYTQSDKTIVIEYKWVSGSGSGSGNNGNGNNGNGNNGNGSNTNNGNDTGNNPNANADNSTTIVDNGVPLGDQPVDIVDEEVPLAAAPMVDAPKTGDIRPLPGKMVKTVVNEIVNIGDNDTALGDAPDTIAEIDDGDVPLAAAPEKAVVATGNKGDALNNKLIGMGVLLGGLALLSLFFLFLLFKRRKKKEEEEGRA